MEEGAKPWERMPGEPLRWYERFNRLRLMPPPRSIAAVFQQEDAKKRKTAREGTSGSWYEYARRWDWDARIAAWDAHQAKEVEAAIAAERQKVLSEGYALMHERVKTLNVVAKKLVSDIAKGKLYRTDVRSVGTGKDAERVDVELFEEGVIRELRGCLDDIAKELGERVKRTETAITELPSNVYIGFNPDEELA